MTPCGSSKKNRRFGEDVAFIFKVPLTITLNMEAECSSETSIHLISATRCHIPEDNIHHCYRREKYPRRQRSAVLQKE
jgi:chorismate mutase